MAVTYVSTWTKKSEFQAGSVVNIAIKGTEFEPYLELANPYDCLTGEWRSEVRSLGVNSQISMLSFYEENVPGKTNIRCQIRAGKTLDPSMGMWIGWRPVGWLDSDGNPGIGGSDYTYFQVRALFETNDPTVTPRMR